MKFWLLLLATILANHAHETAANPGLTIKLSKNGLDYAAKVAVEKLTADIKRKTISDISGNSGHVSYGISNIRIKAFNSPGSSVTTDARTGITMTLTNVGVSVSGNWRYHWKWWFFSVRDSGSFDLSVSGVTLKLSVGMGSDRSGRPTIYVKSRDTRIGNVHIRFHGGASWIYNLFSGYVEDKIEDKLRDRLNDAMGDLINERAKATLQKMKVKVPVNKVTTLDYSLVGAPKIASNYVQSSHRGQFLWTRYNTGTPDVAPPIADLAGTPRMVTFCMSDYVSNSLGYVLYRYGGFFLRHSLNANELSSSVRDILQLNKYPEIAKGHLSGNMQLLMHATEPPTLHTDKNGIIGYISGIVEIRTTNGITLLKLNATAKINIMARLTDEKISGSVQNLGLTINIISPHVDSQTTAKINSLMNTVSRYFIVPKLNEVGRIGYPLPVLDDVKYINPSLHLLKNTVCLATDLRYVF